MAMNKIAPFAVIVDGDEKFADGLVRHFAECNFPAIAIYELSEANRVLAEYFVSLLLVGVAVGGSSGIDFVAGLRSGDNDLPVILLANKDLETHELLALKLGCDIVGKTLPANELVALALAAVGRAGNENLPT